MDRHKKARTDLHMAAHSLALNLFIREDLNMEAIPSKTIMLNMDRKCSTKRNNFKAINSFK
jgi:hypothetical protein